MPIYEYACNKCGHQDTDMDSFSAPRVKKCPSCGKKSFARLISAAAFHLKGGGWYETDFKNKKSEKKDAEDNTAKSETKSDADSKTESKSDSTAESKTDSKSKKADKAKSDSKNKKENKK